MQLTRFLARDSLQGNCHFVAVLDEPARVTGRRIGRDLLGEGVCLELARTQPNVDGENDGVGLEDDGRTGANRVPASHALLGVLVSGRMLVDGWRRDAVLIDRALAMELNTHPCHFFVFLLVLI